MKSKILGLLAVGLLAGPIAAMGEVIDFESLASGGTIFTEVPSYTEDGYQLTSTVTHHAAFSSAGSGQTAWYAGSTSLFNSYGDATTTLSSVTGSLFNLYSIDLAPLSTGLLGSGAFVNFTGHLSGGGTVSQTFQVGNSMAFQTFLFSGFQNLMSVTWVQQYPYHQFDNICIGDNAPCSRVPEPGTLALLGLGLTGLALSRKRKAA